MKCMILAAGRFGPELAQQIAAGREPRLDVFRLADELAAEMLDFRDVERSTLPAVKLAARSAGNSAALAMLGFLARNRCDAFFTTGEDIGLPLAALLKASRSRASHTMIAHTLFPAKKKLFFQLGRVASHIDRMLVYSTSEEQLATGPLRVPAAKVLRIAYHADEQFFRPGLSPIEPDLICAAGQLLRDYPCLVDAVRGVPVRVQIAAGSPWIEARLDPTTELPPNVTWGRLDRYALRDLYSRSAFAVVPIRQNHYQTGIATILEMMAMGKCVVASRTHGQTDTIVDGETGIYVPPGDVGALRTAIERLLRDPEAAARMGAAARRYVEERAGLDRFIERVIRTIKDGHDARQSRS
jgi:glycosyltransferase involved in cell wall biosynthesis